MENFLIGFDTLYWTCIYWYEGVFGIDNPDSDLSLFCFWDNLANQDCKA